MGAAGVQRFDEGVITGGVRVTLTGPAEINMGPIAVKTGEGGRAGIRAKFTITAVSMEFK